MKTLFIILMMILGSFEAFGQVDFTPNATGDGIFARIKGGNIIKFKQQFATVDVSGLDTIDANQEPIRFFKDGNGIVTLVFPKLTHSADSNIAFGSGTIPKGFRPIDANHRAAQVYYANASLLMTIIVYEDGDIDIFYRNWSGTFTAASNTGLAGSITYYSGN